MSSRQHASLDERWAGLLAVRNRSARLTGQPCKAGEPRQVVLPPRAEPELQALASIVTSRIERSDAYSRHFCDIDGIATFDADHSAFASLASENVEDLRSLVRELRDLLEMAYAPVIDGDLSHVSMEAKIAAMSRLQGFMATKLNRLFTLINRALSPTTKS